MKYYFVILTILFFGSCSSNQGKKPNQAINSKESHEVETKHSTEHIVVDKTKISDLLKEVCSIGSYEFINLYPILDSIPNDQYENLILVDSLKNQGFKVINTGRGNWQEGPRIVSYTLSNNKCDCQIDKLYYSTETSDKYRITERIKCKKSKEELINISNNNQIDSLTNKLDNLINDNLLSKYFYPNMSGCGGGLYGYYSDSTLHIIDATYQAELGFSSRKIYWKNERPIKIIYREHFAEWGKYDEKYPSDKYDWDPEKMTYTDTVYKITLGKNHEMEKIANNKIISQSIDSSLINRLLDCSFEMKQELMSERKLEE